jgi:hypothetical protein
VPLPRPPTFASADAGAGAPRTLEQRRPPAESYESVEVARAMVPLATSPPRRAIVNDSASGTSVGGSAEGMRSGLSAATGQSSELGGHAAVTRTAGASWVDSTEVRACRAKRVPG